MTKQTPPPSPIMCCLQANLGLTLIMLLFTVIGKLMGLAFGEKTTRGENGIELGPVRPYLEVVDDLKRTLRTSFHVEVEERNVKEIIEQAQEEVCVKSWETYKDVKAKVMAMAKELEIPTHKPARRRSSFLGGIGDNTRNSISDLARLSEIYDEERPNMPTSNIKDNPMFREQQAMIASLEVQLAEQKQVNVTHEQRLSVLEQQLMRLSIAGIAEAPVGDLPSTSRGKVPLPALAPEPPMAPQRRSLVSPPPSISSQEATLGPTATEHESDESDDDHAMFPGKQVALRTQSMGLNSAALDGTQDDI